MSPTTQRRSNRQPSWPSHHGEDNSSYFQCSKCHESYRRAEHLIRHVRTHTKLRPYRCSLCSKPFARQDLLKRHELGHTGTEAPYGLAGNRVSQACKLCATKKLKCSESKPCQRCVNKGLVCDYETDDVDQGLPPSPRRRSPRPGPVVETAAESPPGRAVNNANHPPTTTVAEAQAGPPAGSSSGTELQETFSQPMSSTHSGGLVPMDAQPPPTTSADNTTYLPGIDGEGVQDHDMLPRSALYGPLMFPASTPQDAGTYSFGFDWDLDAVDFSALEQVEFSPTGYDAIAGDGGTAAPPAPPAAATGTSSLSNTAAAHTTGTNVYQRLSAARSWEPQKSDNDQIECAPLAMEEELRSNDTRDQQPHPSPLKESLSVKSRDRVLHMMLSVTSSANMANIMRALPSAEVLTELIHRYLFKPRNTYINNILHLPTLQLDKQEPEVLGAMIAMGSLRTDSPAAHEFGHAMQEIVRLSSFKRWEENQGSLLDIGLCQAFLLQQYIGFFSGIRRKCVLAEACSKCLSVLIRNGGHLLHSLGTPDEDVRFMDLDVESPDEIWRHWAERESRRRLIYASYIMDTQVSLAHNSQGLYSFLDIETPLPAPQRLWAANTASKWRQEVLNMRQALTPQRSLSLKDLMRNPSLLARHDAEMDASFSRLALLGGLWTLVRECHQLIRIESDGGVWSSLLLASRLAELSSALQVFGSHPGAPAMGRERLEVEILREAVLMSVYVCPEALQLSTGRLLDEYNGTPFVSSSIQLSPTPSRSYASKWVDGSYCRKALWRAGRIICAAVNFPPGSLCDVYASALLHAAVVFWCYGLLSRTQGLGSRMHGNAMQDYDGLSPGHESIHIVDAEGGTEHEMLLTPARLALNGGQGEPVLLLDPVSTMRLIKGILESNWRAGRMPTGSAELCTMLDDLGKAAQDHLDRTSDREGHPMPGTVQDFRHTC